MSVRSIDMPGGSSSPALGEQEQIGLRLMERPTRIIQIPLTANNRIVVGGEGILCGVFIRDGGTFANALTWLSGSSANAAAANNVSLAAQGGSFLNWVTGFEITGNGATAAGPIAVTLTGLAGGTLNYVIEVPTIASASQVTLSVEFGNPGLPASAVNTAIALNVPSFGAGNTAAAASIHGYAFLSSVGPGQSAGPIGTSFDLLDGLDGNGEIILASSTTPGGTASLQMGRDGPLFRRGLFLVPTLGFIRGAVWVKI